MFVNESLMHGIYAVVMLLLLTIVLLENMGFESEIKDHPMYNIKRCLLNINSICFIYLMGWLAGVFFMYAIHLITNI